MYMYKNKKYLHCRNLRHPTNLFNAEAPQQRASSYRYIHTIYTYMYLFIADKKKKLQLKLKYNVESEVQKATLINTHFISAPIRCGLCVKARGGTTSSTNLFTYLMDFGNCQKNFQQLKLEKYNIYTARQFGKL